MKYILILLVFPFMGSSECGKKKESASQETGASTDSLPSCLRKIIDEAGKDTPPNTPEQVDEYLYNEKKTFLITAHCCDQHNVLYDENCTMICAPTGGFTGKGDGKCPDFAATAKHIKVVWKKTGK
ncbi:MAG TPA: hypothetical protein VGO58_09500 [Chitinophagaceae bacterium]|jgi:hypothetical protein|nr:hypothetical protein [Chitinophagaceae bacterium]